MVLTVGKEHNRAERSTLGLATCWAIPILSIYNYIVQGHCNQADKFVHNAADFGSPADKILQIFGSSLPLPPKNSNETLDDESALINLCLMLKGR